MRNLFMANHKYQFDINQPTKLTIKGIIGQCIKLTMSTFTENRYFISIFPNRMIVSFLYLVTIHYLANIAERHYIQCNFLLL